MRGRWKKSGDEELVHEGEVVEVEAMFEAEELIHEGEVVEVEAALALDGEVDVDEVVGAGQQADQPGQDKDEALGRRGAGRGSHPRRPYLTGIETRPTGY